MAKLKDLLPDPPINFSIKPQETVATAARLMGEKNVGILMVMEAGKLVGVFSERDIVARVLAKGKDPNTVKIENVMTREVVTASEDEDPEVCLKKMEQEGCRHIPIIAAGKPIAMVSIRDLMRYILRNKESDLKMLEEYVTSP